MSGNEIAVLTQSAFTEGFKEGELYILEKLKEEIKEERDSYDVSCRNTFNICIGLIDKYITELKGE